jgi:hypothetical protein
MSKPTWKLVQETNLEFGLEGVFLRTLGWDKPRDARPTTTRIGSISWVWKTVATLQGAALIDAKDLATPSHEQHRRLTQQLKKMHPELIVRFGGSDVDTWYWPRKLSSGSMTLESFQVRAGAVPDFLAQRLSGLKFGDSELGSITPAKVRDRVRGHVETTKITKEFYRKFQSHHETLASSIVGLPDECRSIYSTTLLNRLMFIWFLQKKLFLNGDSNYLSSCLASIRNLSEPKNFYAFYKNYLLDLFFNHLNSNNDPKQSSEISQIIGDVPYINGGLFGPTELELAYDINVPDTVFESIFNFFNDYTWHLDTRPTGNPSEINPEVIGYIFEQYINFTADGKKKDGAYYTPQDVSDYMVSRTIPARILDNLESLGLDFRAPLITNPLRYLGHTIPEDGQQTFVDESEIERARRLKITAETRSRLESGMPLNIDELLGLNVDLNLLALDMLEELDDPGLALAIWRQLNTLRVVDPTCGSGAFLFAALNALEEFYATIFRKLLDLGVSESAGQQGSAPLRYFLRRQIVCNNLFGADIMPDAIETAKLRLFLALVSCLDTRDELEPLPDLDFNFAVGNLVLGISSADDLRRAFNSSLLGGAEISSAEESIRMIKEGLDSFTQAQLHSAAETDMPKQELKKIQGLAKANLDGALARSFGIQQGDQAGWIQKFQPLHWITAFPAAIIGGGFDVIVGNPPYINKKNYPAEARFATDGFATGNFDDFYEPCVERMLSLLSAQGRLSVIVMSSLAFGQRTKTLRKLLARDRNNWVSTFGRLPDQLFEGAKVRNAIVAIGPVIESPSTFVSQHVIFTRRSRAWIFHQIEHNVQSLPVDLGFIRGGVIEPLVATIINLAQIPRGNSGASLWMRPTAAYWFPVLDFLPPTVDRRGDVLRPSDPRVMQFAVPAGLDSKVAFLALAGKIGYLYWSAVGDDMDSSKRQATDFLRAVAALPQESLVAAAAPAYEKFLALRPSLVFASLNAGEAQVNYKLDAARLVTDEFDRVLLAAFPIQISFELLELAYARVMRSTTSSTKAFGVPREAFESWASSL